MSICSRKKIVCTHLLGLILSLFMAGCAGRSNANAVVQYLDGRTGITVTGLPEPLVFFSEESALAANVRDYVYIGPVELNRSGRYEYLLWADFCSTIDRGRQPNPSLQNSIILMLDGMPMDLGPISPAVEVWPYTSPVAGGKILQYGITRNQLHALARADEILIVAENSARSISTYRRWDNRADFLQFVSYLNAE